MMVFVVVVDLEFTEKEMRDVHFWELHLFLNSTFRDFFLFTVNSSKQSIWIQQLNLFTLSQL